MQVEINTDGSIVYNLEGAVPMTVAEVHAHIREVTGREPVGEWPEFFCRDMLNRELRSQGYFDKPGSYYHMMGAATTDGDEHSIHLPPELAHYPLIAVPSAQDDEMETGAATTPVEAGGFFLEVDCEEFLEHLMAHFELPPLNPFFSPRVAIDWAHPDSQVFPTYELDAHVIGHDLTHELDYLHRREYLGGYEVSPGMLNELESDRLGRLFSFYRALSRLEPHFDINTGTVTWRLSEDDDTVH